MAAVARLNWGKIVAQGVLAGIAGGILLDVFLIFAAILPAHGSVPGFYQSIASTALGKVAFTGANYVWIGLSMHGIVSIAWGIGYAYIAHTRPGVNSSWPLSGVVFGFIVYVVMQIVLLGDGHFTPPRSLELTVQVIAHCVFFGLPVAAVTRAQLR